MLNQDKISEILLLLEEIGQDVSSMENSRMVPAAKWEDLFINVAVLREKINMLKNDHDRHLFLSILKSGEPVNLFGNAEENEDYPEKEEDGYDDEEVPDEEELFDLEEDFAEEDEEDETEEDRKIDDPEDDGYGNEEEGRNDDGKEDPEEDPEKEYDEEFEMEENQEEGDEESDEDAGEDEEGEDDPEEVEEMDESSCEEREIVRLESDDEEADYQYYYERRYRNKPDWMTDVAGERVDNIYRAISMNDRLYYISELFNGDEEQFMLSIERLNELRSFEDAVEYLRGAFPDWDENTDAVYRFYMSVRRKYNG